MKNQKNALLIIDPQYDFCNPAGALFVPGADEDMKKLGTFIANNANFLAHICVTIDSHPINDISHPSFWADKNGNSPAPFTQITLEEVKNGIWKPLFSADKVEKYLTVLEAQGEFPHLIWPTHCLNGSIGASIDETLMDALKIWSKLGFEYQIAVKGTYPLTEHFGIFMAQVPDEEQPETGLNTTLIQQLNEFDNVFLAGEAKSHCVGTSLKQLMTYAPALAQKVIVIEDCMSDVPNLGHLGAPIYEEARKRGIKFVQADFKI